MTRHDHDAIVVERFTYGPFAENTYLLTGPSGSNCAVVDPGFDTEPLLALIRERDLTVEWIVNTHGHLDHVAGNALFKRETGAPIILHPGDAEFLANVSRQATAYGLTAEDSPPADHDFVEGEPFIFDGVTFEVMHTPGHSPGGVCLRFGGRMLVGDTLFQGSIGRTDLPMGSFPDLVRSIRHKLFKLPDEIVCFTGHGDETTIGEEKASNPFVSDAAIARFAQELS